MGKEDICFISAVEMKEKICDQEISSSELVEIIIDRIERVNPIINAICTPTLDLARQLAKKADDRVKKGEKLPPLNGIPTSIKDLMMTKGIRTTYGSKIHENYIPDVNDVAVERLLNAGIVMLGKTNTPEFGYAGVTHNKVFGITKNPWNLEKNPGGSSGGAAAAVASGISPLALGSDGGGSLRHPACFCGVFAIKPSFGRIPVYPTIGMGGETITHYGPIARYVKDAALMLDVMKGPHEADRYTIPAQDINYVDKIDELPDKLKIGYSLNLGYAKVIDPEVERSIRDSVQRFSKMDWGVEEVKLKMRNPETGYYIWYTSMYGYDFKGKVKKWRDEMDPNLVKLVEGGMTGSSLDIFKALHERRKIYSVFYEYFKNYDLLITPTTAIPPFEQGIMFPKEINGKMVSPTAWMPFTFPFNFTGHPAATVPSGFTSDGLPIGMQIIGRRFDELTVLRAAKAFENLAPWQERRPPLK